jgi:hypothetical protein
MNSVGIERELVVGRAPWIFRKVILPSMERRRFARLAPFAISPVLQT